MFTGIIEEIGTVVQVKKGKEAMQLVIQGQTVVADVKLGDSIAVNGVCLTVTQFTNNQFHADVMPETFVATNLKQLQAGDNVNLERAMAANGRFGGHIVSGHVDSVATITQKRAVANAVYVELALPRSLVADCIEKGSITLDGTSLTIFSVQAKSITVSLIPHTFEKSILGAKKVGDSVNVETDLLSKYVKQHLQGSRSNVTMDFLQQHGF